MTSEANDLIRWVAQTVHQAHHEGPLEECKKNTCAAAVDWAARQVRGAKPDPKIFIFCNSCSPKWHSFMALTEDGDAVTGHVCSAPATTPITNDGEPPADVPLPGGGGSQDVSPSEGAAEDEFA